MASTINAKTIGTGGIEYNADASGNVAIQSDGTTAVTFDTNQTATFTGAVTATGNITTSGSFVGDGSGLTGVSAGKVLQVVQTYDRSVSSYTMLDTNNTYGSNYGLSENGIDLTTLDISITPSSTSSKILLMTNIMFAATSAAYGVFRLKRGIGGTTPAYSSSDLWMNTMNTVPGTLAQMGSLGWSSNGDSAWQSRVVNFNWLDSPSTTSAVVYRFNFRAEGDNGSTFYLNRAIYNTNDYGANTGVSSIIAMEVAG